MDEERFGRAVEDAIDEFADHAADDLVFGVRGSVNKGAVLAALFEIGLGFEDFHHGHDGGVGDFAALEQDFVNIADGGGAALPDELHDFEFLGGKRVVLGAHRQFSSTNYLGCQAKSVDPRAPKEPSGYNRFRKWHGYTKPARRPSALFED